MSVQDKNEPREVGGTRGDGSDPIDPLDPDGPCMACGSPNARIWKTPDGPARLCPPCATLNGLGCP